MTEAETWKAAADILEHYAYALLYGKTPNATFDDLHEEFIMKSKAASGIPVNQSTQ